MMADRGTMRRFTIVVTIVAWFGCLLQLYLSLRLSLANGKTVGEGLNIFFGYFTVLTNILVALVLTLPLVTPASTAGRFAWRPGTQTATAAAIAAVGVAYFLLLRNVWSPRGWQLLADAVLHYLTPILFLAHWWFVVPKSGLRWFHVPAWLSFPTGYMIYMLVRGELTGLYPYYFLDAGALGYGKVLANGLGMLLGFVLMASLLLVAADLQRTLGPEATPEGDRDG